MYKDISVFFLLPLVEAKRATSTHTIENTHSQPQPRRRGYHDQQQRGKFLLFLLFKIMIKNISDAWSDTATGSAYTTTRMIYHIWNQRRRVSIMESSSQSVNFHT